MPQRNEAKLPRQIDKTVETNVKTGDGEPPFKLDISDRVKRFMDRITQADGSDPELGRK